nr:hypothetical protein [Pseudomonas izuensis]
MSTSQLVIGYLCGFFIFSILVWIGVALHMAYNKMDMLLGLFQNSAGVKTLSPLKHGGPWGKLMLIGGISGLVTFPRSYLKNGQLNREDLQAIPPSLRRKLAVMQWNLLVLLTALTLLVFIGKSGLLN